MRIWVTRPEPGAARSGARLRALGHDPLIAPIFDVVATEDPPPHATFGGILLTSGQAVPALIRSGLGQGRTIFAVGDRTAQAARLSGIKDVVTAGGDSADLARLVRTSLPMGSALLHIAGRDRKAEPAASLRAAGFVVLAWTAYEARSLTELPPAVARALSGFDAQGAPTAALHYSRRGARTALYLTRKAGLEGAFRVLEHYCLSRDVALPLVEAGIAAHFVPARPTEDALLEGLDGSA